MQSTTVIVLILAAALVTTAVFVGTQVFKKKTVEASRDAMMDQMKDLAVSSLKYYNRPVIYGGGGRSFANIEKQKRGSTKNRAKAEKDKMKKQLQGTEIWETHIGIYSVVTATQDSVVIEGVGNEIGKDGQNPVCVKMVLTNKGPRTFTILN